MNNTPRRGPWSPAEDQRLMALIEDHGPSNWVRISQMLATRTPKQCRERYHQNLKPSLNHEPITDEEGLFIEQLVAQYGKKWAEIARHLNGRSDNAVKNWWNGGANKRRRASLTIDGGALERQDSGTQQPHGMPSNNAPPHHQVPPPPPPPSLPQQQQYSHHHSGGIPPPPPPPPSGFGPPGYSYPSVGHRVSLPNIHTTDNYSNSRFYKPATNTTPPSSSQPPPPVIFNSAYTDSSSGFASSGKESNHSVDPQTPLSNHRGPGTTATGTSSANNNATRRPRHEELSGFPYSRRVSAAAATPSGHSSSRASSIISSASDNEDPLHSLSKYSLNSASNSRRNSAVPPTPEVLPPLSPSAAGPVYNNNSTNQPANGSNNNSSNNGYLASPFGQRHSITGYPTIPNTNNSSPLNTNYNGFQKLKQVDENDNNNNNTSNNNNDQPQSQQQTQPETSKLKISNLLS